MNREGEVFENRQNKTKKEREKKNENKDSTKARSSNPAFLKRFSTKESN
jgi:hypothetical protein